jgi:hypothetical protein
VIRRLVQAALAEGLPAEPYWSLQEGLVYELTTGKITETPFLTVLPSRTSGVVPGFLAEKAANLQLGNTYRTAQAALAERWGAETGHALPLALASLLRSNSAIPDEPRWIAFAMDGKTCADVPELRALVTRSAQPEMLAPERCVSCGYVSPIVRLHGGNAGMGNVAPVLVSWDRKSIVTRGSRQAGANLPTCLTCMRLYVQWLCKHTSYDHLAGRFSFTLDGQVWVLGNNVRAGFVVDVLPDDLRVGLWDTAVAYQATKREKKYMGKDREAKWQEMLQAIDRVVAETDDQHYLLGYLYGVLEWAAWVMRLKSPTLADVAQAPATCMGAFLLACHDGAKRYAPPAKKGEKADGEDAGEKTKRGRPPADKPPITTRWAVSAWLSHVTQLATARMEAMPRGPLLPDSLPSFALGYAHSLGKRGPQRSSGEINGHEPTPWAIRLRDALRDRGEIVETEYYVEYDYRGKVRHFRLDLAALDVKLAIEADGRLKGLDTRDFVNDSRRSAVLLAQGWRVQRVPNARLNRTSDIAEVVDEVLAILASLRSASAAAQE